MCDSRQARLSLERGDLPPDLALEIDLTSKSLDRFPIYTRLEVPELWCCDAGQITIYQLQEQEYVAVGQSTIFPMLNVGVLPDLIEQYRDRGRLALRKATREWVREQIDR
jgi:Uma2 family endonuclease